MKKTAWVWLALFLSLGINLGLLASRWLPSERIETELASDASMPDAATPDDTAPVEPRLPPPVMRRIARVATELGLEGAERDAFLDLQRDFFRRFVHSRRLSRRLQDELRRLLLSDAPDRRRADALLERLVAAESEGERAFLDHYFAVRELLDDEQMRRYRRVLGELRRGASELGARAPSRRGPLHRQPPRPAPGRDPTGPSPAEPGPGGPG